MLVAFWLRVSSSPAMTISTGKGSRGASSRTWASAGSALGFHRHQHPARAQRLARQGGEERWQALGAAGDGEQQGDLARDLDGGGAEEADEPDHAGQPGEGGEQRDGAERDGHRARDDRRGLAPPNHPTKGQCPLECRLSAPRADVGLDAVGRRAAAWRCGWGRVSGRDDARWQGAGPRAAAAPIATPVRSRGPGASRHGGRGPDRARPYPRMPLAAPVPRPRGSGCPASEARKRSTGHEGWWPGNEVRGTSGSHASSDTTH